MKAFRNILMNIKTDLLHPLRIIELSRFNTGIPLRCRYDLGNDGALVNVVVVELKFSVLPAILFLIQQQQ